MKVGNGEGTKMFCRSPVRWHPPIKRPCNTLQIPTLEPLVCCETVWSRGFPKMLISDDRQRRDWTST